MKFLVSVGTFGVPTDNARLSGVKIKLSSVPHTVRLASQNVIVKEVTKLTLHKQRTVQIRISRRNIEHGTWIKINGVSLERVGLC